jgi:hypothetical protein
MSKEDYYHNQRPKRQVPAYLVLIFLLPIVVMLVAPVLGGLGAMSGGGEFNVRIGSDNNEYNNTIYGNHNQVVNGNGNKTSYNFDDSHNEGIGAAPLMLCGVWIIIIAGGAFLLLAVLAGFNAY